MVVGGGKEMGGAVDVATSVYASREAVSDAPGLEAALSANSTNISAACCGGAPGVDLDKFASRLMWYEDFIVGSFLVFVGVLSVLGNVSTVLMFRQRLRQLTPAEVLLLNLALMHLFLALCSYPAPMVSSFAHRWLFGDIGCEVYGFVCYLLGIATITSMAALAVVRYLKTCSLAYGRRLTSEHMKVVLVGVYMYSVFWAVLPLFSFVSDFEVEPFGTSCTLNWANPANSAQVYIVLVVTLVVTLPAAVMVWCYARILLLVRRNYRNKLTTLRNPPTSQRRSELQITLVSGLVCAGFLVAWLPYCLVSVVTGLMGHQAPVYVTLVPVLLAKSSCAYNPVIYVFVNARYRKEMLGILQKHLSPLMCCLRGQERHDEDDDEESSQEVKSVYMTRTYRESPILEEDLSTTIAVGTRLQRVLATAADLTPAATLNLDLTAISAGINLKPDVDTSAADLTQTTRLKPDLTITSASLPPDLTTTLASHSLQPDLQGSVAAPLSN
ncbi:opsin-5 [Procambarus clarkii]|uniref:opsin-5 n=1 Tax=Procambarus clarkii TaxID=6728 RepID=UPI003744185B